MGNLKKLIILSLLFSLSISAIEAQVIGSSKLPKNSKETKKIIDQYLKFQSTFRSKLCTPQVEKEFSTLNQNFKEFGKFIPTTLDDKIDVKTISSHMDLFDEKEKWISWSIDRLNLNKDFTVTIGLIKQLKDQREKLIKLKHEFMTSSSLSEEKKKELERTAKETRANFSREFQILLNQVPFLLSFNYPIDHLELRKSYDHYKEIKTKEGRAKSNQIFFARRILQDGMYDEDMVRNDSVLRAAIDTFQTSLNNHQGVTFFTENERYDSSYVLKAIETILDVGADKLLGRLVVWRERNRQIREFYRNILDNKVLREGEFTTVQKILEEKARATGALKDYVLKKEADVYRYWSEQDELYQALFALETILYSEVGTLDGRGAEERREIAQVVLNRFFTEKYNHIPSSDVLYPYLVNVMGERVEQKNKAIISHPWLNVLLKEAEFSFTLFFISGNLHVYCPDQTRTGQFLRRENVKIALESLKNYKKTYNGLRYYSRYSMQGRIEMDSIWTDYVALAEKPGKKAVNSEALLKKYKANNYTYLYDFKSAKGDEFIVIEIDGKSYVVKKNSAKEVYHYRNIHMFKFFGPKAQKV